MNFLQSQQWFDTKTKLGNKCYSVGNYFFQTTKLPYVKKTIGYMPRVDLKKIDINELIHKAKEANCIFLTIDPENYKQDLDSIEFFNKMNLIVAEGKPIHLQNTVLIDLNKSEEELLASMKQKTRYNLKLAQKKGLNVVISSENVEYEKFVELYLTTLKRQNYSGRSKNYLDTVWNEFKGKSVIATVYYNSTPLASWFLIAYDNVLTYVYGGSSEEYKNLMGPYLLVWELVKFGKEKGYQYFDLFGVKKDLSDGYSRFKSGFGGKQIEYSDTVDLVIDSKLYSIFNFVYKLRNKIAFR